MPLASAFGMGIDAASVTTMKNAGATPKYGQTWVGDWMADSGWGGFDRDLTTMRDAGVTPVVMWYYWGDSISPDCVKYGCDGRTKGEWDSLAKTMASHIKSIMGTRLVYVVLEPEFQKNGIESWDTFDGYLASQANTIRSLAPSADLVVGFGHWGNWDIFDRAVAASDLVGFQVLRASTRDSSSKALATADYMIEKTKALKSRWGKGVMVFDLGIATYGGWEGVQEKTLQNILAKRAALDDAGVKAIIWRYVSDNHLSGGYFGNAEYSWGVKYSWGGKKPAYDELATLMSGGSGSTSTSSTPTSTASGFDASFSGVQVQEYWVQASVSGNQGIAKVEARVAGGSWQILAKQSWGGWAKSLHVLSGQKVEFRATSTSGATDVSGGYYR
ncbi:MAG TPA: hypothetical protein VM370_00295 [Candidatus Thermoplasmatota archaeon]|nr:hypothetical protein [Candidatus Thermoplasmatota archaeon]